MEGLSRKETHAGIISCIEDVMREIESVGGHSDDAHQRTVALRDALNASAPVRRLPGELLVKIILDVKDDARDDIIKSISQLIKMTHVCHRWRVVATTSPTLWSTIYYGQHALGKLDMIRMCLHRSQLAPLEPRVEWQYIDDALRFLDAADKHRIAGLCILTEPGHELQNLPRCLDAMTNVVRLEQRMPSLELNYLDRYRLELIEFFVKRPPQLHLPAAHAARLRKLSVEHASVPANISLSSLRCLEMTSNHPNHTAWLSMVKHCPTLEVVRLTRTYLATWIYAFPGVHQGSSVTTGVGHWPGGVHISMPGLHTLALTQLGPDFIIAILNRFRFPRVAQVFLDFREHSAIRAEGSSPLSYLRAFGGMCTHNTLALSTLSLEVVMDDEDLYITTWSSRIPDPRRESQIEVIVPSRTVDADSGPRLMLESLKPFSSSPLTFLCISTWIPIGDALCLKLLRQYPLLEELRVARSANAFRMLNALYEPVTPGAGTLVCGGLKVLALYLDSVTDLTTHLMDMVSYRLSCGARQLEGLHLTTKASRRYSLRRDLYARLSEHLSGLVGEVQVTYDEGKLDHRASRTLRIHSEFDSID